MTEPLFTADADPVEAALAELRQIPRYPFSDEIDRPMIRKLMDHYPTVDIAFEIRKWQVWLMERPELTSPKRKKRTNYRARLLTWVNRAGTHHGTSSGRAGPSTGAHRPEAYGATSETLERW